MDKQTSYTSVPISHLKENFSSDPMQFITNLTSSFDPIYGHNFPVFTRVHIETMLRDSRVTYGLGLLKGPIKTFTYFLPEKEAEDSGVHAILREQGMQFSYVVKSEDQEITDYVIKLYKTFWDDGLEDFLRMLDWGFSCSQVHYDFEDPEDIKSINYKGLTWYHPTFCRAILKKNSLIGAEIRQPDQGDKYIKLYGPKFLWGVHDSAYNRIFGRSRLFNCFTPWHEMWCPYGARDIRRTWFQKNSFDSGEIRYPIGKTVVEEGLPPVDNRDLAVRYAVNIKTGGVRIFPSDKDADGKDYKWSYQGPEARVTPQGLMEYPEGLRNEILEGLGVPPEVVESSGDGGFGSATGRKIPMTVYFSTLSNIAGYSVRTFKRSVVDWLVFLRFGKKNAFTIESLAPIKGEQQQDGPNTGFVDRTVQGTSLSE